MRTRSSWFALVMLAAFADAAQAGTPGINLSWNACATDVASSQRCYTCDGHAGAPFVFQGSFRPSHSIPDFAGCASTVNITFTDPSGNPVPVPDFWQSACAASHDRTSDPDTVGGCDGFAFGTTYSGFAESYPSPTTIQLRIEWAISPPAPVPLVAGRLYPGFAFTMDADGVVNGGCQGCATAALIQVAQIEVYGFASPAENELISAQDQRNWVRWQGTSGYPCSVTPTRNATWGAIKSMYR